MRGLILQLAKLDSEAEAQIRIVDFFDSLLRSHATLENVLRATAGLTGTVVGVTLSATGEILGFDAQGRGVDLTPQDLSAVQGRLVLSNGREVARAWMLDPDGPSRTKDLVLERLVLTCEVLWESDRLGTGSRALERLLDPTTPRREREQLCQLLADRFPDQVRVLCVRPKGSWMATSAWYDAVESAVAQSLGRRRNGLGSVRSDDRLWLVLPPGQSATFSVVPDAVTGVGPVVPLIEAASSATLARAAVDYPSAAATAADIVAYEELGPVCLLGISENTLLASDPFVSGIVAALELDPEGFDVLEALTRCGSVRAAAKQLHLHHSSVAGRIERIEQAAGVSLRMPGAMFALRLALPYWETRAAPEAAKHTPSGAASATS